MQLDELASLDDDQLGDRIGVAFNTLPTPDPARLAAIRNGLPLARPARVARRRWPLWAVLLVSGAAAAAAWYGATSLLQSPGPVAPAPQTRQPAFNGTAHDEPANIRAPLSEQQIREKQDNTGSPVIIRQEQY